LIWLAVNPGPLAGSFLSISHCRASAKRNEDFGTVISLQGSTE
jgi:hypothetical protein